MTFFKFVKIPEPDKLLNEIKPLIDDICKSFDVKVLTCSVSQSVTQSLIHSFNKGTVVFAKEGFNGQLCIPTAKLSPFIRSLSDSSGLFFDLADLINYGATPSTYLLTHSLTYSLTHSLTQGQRISMIEIAPFHTHTNDL